MLTWSLMIEGIESGDKPPDNSHFEEEDKGMDERLEGEKAKTGQHKKS